MAMRDWRLSLVAVVMVLWAAVVGAQQEEGTPDQPAAETAAGEQEVGDEQETGAEAAGAAEEPAEPQMAYETVVDFETGTPIALETRVGEIEVRAIEFSVKGVKTGFMAKPFSSGNDDLKAELTVALNMATAAATKQKIGVLVEFLDDDENVIDRSGSNFGFKERSKIFTFNFTTLKWAAERIGKVKLSFEARN